MTIAQAPESANAAEAPDTPPSPKSPEAVASNLSDVLRTAPIFQQSPAISLALASFGGNVPSNTQAVAALAHARALDTAAQRMAGALEPSDLGQAPKQGGSSIWGDIGGAFDTASGALQGAADTVRHTAAAGVDVASKAVNEGVAAVGGEAKKLGSAAYMGALGINQKGGVATPNQTVGSPEMAAVSSSLRSGTAGILHQVGQQVNPVALMNTPTHLYRTWVDIEHRHGPAAMVEAMIPSLVGAGAGVLLTHSAKGAEEGTDLAASLLDQGATPDAAATAGEAEEAGAGANAAQRTGQIAKTLTKAVVNPVAQAVGAPIRAAASLSSSPAFLGGNLGGIATQLDQSFKDSWDRTTSGSPPGEIGSFGRLVATGVEDVGSRLGLPGTEKNSMFFNALSGGLDAFSNIAVLDPLGAAGRVIGQARSAEGFSGVLGHWYGGTQITSPADVDRIIKQYKGADHFVDDVVGKTPGEILNKYGTMQLNGPLAVRLGHATTREEVIAVLKDSARSIELATTTGKMPTLTAYTKIKSALADTRLGSALTVPLPTMYDADLAKFTGREFTAGDPNAVPSIMHLMTAMGERPQVVTDLGTTLLETADPKVWGRALSNVSQVAIMRQVVKAIGNNPLTEQMGEAVNRAADELFGGRGAGFKGKFGFSPEGTDLGRVFTEPGDPEAQSRKAAIFFTQQGKMVMPTVRDVQRTSKQIADVVKWSSAKGVYAKGENLRDWLDVTVNHKFFQPLALATGGWALRVSSSEALLNAVRLGPLNYSAAAIARSALKHNLALGLIEADPAVLAQMDKTDRIAQEESLSSRAIQSSRAKTLPARVGQNITRNVIAAVRGVLAGTEESLLKGIGKQRFLDAATKLILLHDGYLIPGGISAIHNLPLVGQDEVARKEADINDWLSEKAGTGRRVRNVGVSGNYGTLSPEQSGFFGEWSAHAGLISADTKLGRPLAAAYRDYLKTGMSEDQASNMAIQYGKRLLENLDATQRGYMLRDVAKSQDSTVDPLTDWATQAIRAIRGATTGENGVIVRPLLDDIADGTVPPTAKQMLEKYGGLKDQELPQAIPGREVSMNVSQVLQRAASYMHTRAFGPIVNYLSREPTFIADFANESKLLEHQVAAGVITQDQSDVIAQTRAIFKSIRFVHNPQDRMKIEQTLHIVAPFYFAKNQAIRRAGRLLASNPGAFEQYLKLNLAVQNISFQANQKNGQASFVVPGSAVVGAAMTNLMGHIGLFPTGSIPISLSGSTDAMQAMVPWSGNGTEAPGSPQSLFSAIANPDLGPLGAIPVKGVADFASGFAATGAKDILGPIGANTAWWTYLVPNSILQHVAETAFFVGGSNSLGTMANSALLSALAAVADSSDSLKPLTQIQQSDISGGAPTPQTTALDATDQAALIKQVKNMTAVLLLGRLLASGASPVSLSLQRADLKITDQVQAYITKAGGNLVNGLDAFMRDHPNEVASTVYQSTSDVGSGWGDTAKVGQWIEQNKALVKAYPNAAQWLIPPTDNKGPFSESTHLLQIAENLRHVDTPAEFLSNIYVAAGNAWYYNSVRPQLEAALKANPSNSYNIYNEYDKFIANYGNRNPQWETYWKAENSTQDRATSLDQLTQMLKDPATPKNEQSQRLGALVNGYNQYLGEKANAATAAQRATLKASWQAEMVATQKAWPDVAPAITDLFAHLS